MSYLNPEHKFASRMRRIHLIGIGGSGMSGIAEVLHNLDFKVSGSDIQASKVVQRLLDMGIQVMLGHDAAHVELADVVVYSSAIKAEKPRTEGRQGGTNPGLDAGRNVG